MITKLGTSFSQIPITTTVSGVSPNNFNATMAQQQTYSPSVVNYYTPPTYEAAFLFKMLIAGLYPKFATYEEAVKGLLLTEAYNANIVHIRYDSIPVEYLRYLVIAEAAGYIKWNFNFYVLTEMGLNIYKFVAVL